METGESKNISSTLSTFFHRSSLFRSENASSYLALFVHGQEIRGSLFDLHLNKLVAIFSFENQQALQNQFESEQIYGKFSREHHWQSIKHYSLYPSSLFEEAKSAEIAHLSFGVKNKEAIQNQELKALGLKLIYESESGLQPAVGNLLQQSRLIHKGGHELFIFLSGELVSLIAWKEGKLQICTSNTLDSEADAAYFTASYIESQSSTDLKVYIAGQPHFDQSLGLLKRFYSKVEGMPLISDAFDPIDFPNLRAAENFESIHLHLCAS